MTQNHFVIFQMALIFLISGYDAGQLHAEDSPLDDVSVSSGTQADTAADGIDKSGYPVDVEEALSHMAGQNFTRGSAGTRRIALTFDDGPSSVRTVKILDILGENEIRATFFVLGEKVEDHPEVLRRIIDEGHEIGNHSYTHRDMKKLDITGIKKEIESTQEIIKQYTGMPPRIFRPPYGSTNKELRQYCKEAGMVICKWSVDPKDWKKSVSIEAMRSTIREQTRGGSVIILHDIKKKTQEALPQIIDDLKDSGFEFILLSRMIADAWQDKMSREAEAETSPGSSGSTAVTTRRPLRLSLDETDF
jgi:peptidoglycan/xylan/chitin deacetylase (PgdA/CDA1 family)